MDLLGEASDDEPEIPDIIISRSSIPESERLQNIRMIPQLSKQDEETETDSTKESGAEDFEDASSDHRELKLTSSNAKLETSTLQQGLDTVSVPSKELTATKEPQQDALTVPATTADKADAPSGVFPAPNIEEFFSDNDDVSEDEQASTEDHVKQLKADTAAFEHLEGIDQPNNQNNFGELW